ncbi:MULTISPECIES: carboxymuconolactone decarboxylase family protein [unclassified Moraxella]|uniref:carboxymuconolactone decarboxylase family protein n=1 Tax=unclassified Moraxella TaxID=2685852 RepID=UPI003AF97980
MSKSYNDITKRVSINMGKLRKEVPNTLKAFSELSSSALTDGALDKKQKELIALAIAVSQRCDPCIGFHMKALVKLGATRAEVAETLGMCVYMGGGPALMYASDAMEAFDEFSQA